MVHLSQIQKVKIILSWSLVHSASGFLTFIYAIYFSFDKSRPKGNREETQKFLSEHKYPTFVNKIRLLTSKEGLEQEKVEIGHVATSINIFLGHIVFWGIIIGIIALIALNIQIIAAILALYLFFLLLKYAIKKGQEAEIAKHNINTIDTLSGYEFEQYLKRLFTKMGYSVKETRIVGDQGADLIISGNGNNTVVQVKRHHANIGNKAVQEVVAAVRHYKSNSGMVVTNSYFTPAAIELAKSNDIELIDRKLLQEWIAKYIKTVITA